MGELLWGGVCSWQSPQAESSINKYYYQNETNFIFPTWKDEKVNEHKNMTDTYNILKSKRIMCDFEVMIPNT